MATQHEGLLCSRHSMQIAIRHLLHQHCSPVLIKDPPHDLAIGIHVCNMPCLQRLQGNFTCHLPLDGSLPTSTLHFHGKCMTKHKAREPGHSTWCWNVRLHTNHVFDGLQKGYISCFRPKKEKTRYCPTRGTVHFQSVTRVAGHLANPVGPACGSIALGPHV